MFRKIAKAKDKMDFGQRLAALRCVKGLSQTQLADLLNTTRKMIDHYERRAGNPSLDFIQRAAEALDVSVAELLGSEPNSKRGKPGPTPQLQLRFDQIRSDVSHAKNRSSSSDSSILF